MILTDWLADLSGRGVQLWAESDQLRVRAPKGVLTPPLRDLLAERKEQILSLLRQSPTAAAGADLPRIVPAPDQLYEPFPLNDIQQAYWVGRAGIVELGNITTHAYIEVEGEGVDVRRLSAAWRKLIERHPMLRAVVLPTGEQRILREVRDYEVDETDVGGLEQSAAQARLGAIREEMSHQVLPADRWPLFDIRATHLGKGRFRIHFSIDLLITDFGSLMLLLKEWGHFYRYPDLALPALEVSFRDLVLAEQALRGSELYRRSQSYWLERLDTLPPRPQLPLAKNPSAIEKPWFRRREQVLKEPVWQRLKQRAREQELTASALLLAAYAEVLTAWSRSPCFTINLTQYNRLQLHPQINEIVGNSISITLLEVDNSAAEPFAVRARRLQQQLWRDLNHTTFSGLQVLRELIRRQRQAQSALMPVVFTSILGLESFGKGSADLNFGELVYMISQTPQVWLDQQVMEQAGALLLSWDTVEELFPEGLLDDMFGAYCALLTRLSEESSAWREPLTLVPAAQLERRAAVNDTAAPVPEGLLHTLFADRVAERAGEPAVITPRRTLSYGELFDHANRVARRLRRWGAVPDTLVAVVMEKGWEQIAGVLGILGAGAAYMPLDPELPAERLHRLLERGEVTVALTQSHLDERLAWPEGLRRLCVDGEELAEEIPEPLAPAQTADNIAYVLFTSGSTGIPKGAVLDHRGPLNTVTDFNQRSGVGAGDRVLGLSALSFDLSVYDVFGILAAGGAVVLPDPALAKDPAHWVELMADHRITVWNSVPTLMKMLVEYLSGEPEKVPAGLRLVVMSGDWIPVDLPDRIKSLWQGIRVIGSGGPTETSIWNVFYPIEEVDPAWTSIPYGRPSRNQRSHVLDGHLDPRPDWVAGELWAEGMGLARGYWRDEEVTRANFVIHPRTGARLYRTGDLGRWLPDGNLEILGRADFQVKIGGHRIEPGEIEAALRQHPEVGEAVVGAVGEERGERQLLAWVVPRDRLRSVPPAVAGAAAASPADPSFDALGEGVILDPVQRIEFKLRQEGLRRWEPDQPELRLPGAEIGDERRQAYRARVSIRRFAPDAVPLAQFGRFLSALQQLQRDDDPMPKYRYPSAGSLYPVQTCLHVKPGRVEGVDSGVYAYDPVEHRLLLLTAGAGISAGVHVEHNRPVFEQAAFSLFLIGKAGAIAPIYGKQLGREFSMLEAGYIGQLLMTSAAEARLGICPIGAMQFEAVRELFRLDGDHMLLHSFLGGLPGTAEVAAAPEPEAQSAEEEPLVADLRDHLRRKLPPYMVPSLYMLLDALPLNANGKVDRKALPVPGAVRPRSDVPMVEPRNELERRLAEIVQGVLGLETVGIHHNFFELGANSLQLVQIHNRLKQTLEIDIPIVQMFQRPTISDLAQRLSSGQVAGRSVDEIEEEALRRKRRRLERRRKGGQETPSSQPTE